MELLRVIHKKLVTVIIRPLWQDNTFGLHWADDNERPTVRLDDARLYFDHPDPEQSLTKVQSGEHVAVEGTYVPAGMYRAENEKTLVPVALSNWGIARVRVCGHGITVIKRPAKTAPTRLTGRVLSQTHTSEWLYGAACAAGQFGTPFMSPVIGFIDDGEYVLATRSDGSKAWLEVA